ncbi:MAG: polysaccharide deacetylase family protein [Pseudomonadota bacterium]|nr:polysaccharide deacetylase family protein [Pseudomonadota bacterium]
MKKAWYILNYHDISWEQNEYLNAVGESFPPDIFSEHVAALSNEFELVSIQTGWERLKKGEINSPILSFWFDDGYTGVRRYAEPILSEKKVAGGVAVNSDFLLRKDFFWRLKLSYLSNVDGLRFLRPILRENGYKTGDSIREFTLTHVNETIVDGINKIYEQLSSPLQREDSWRLFEDIDGIKQLAAKGWDISNHTCGHFPLLNKPDFFSIQNQFKSCEERLVKHLGFGTTFWVLPFGRPFYNQLDHQRLFEKNAPDDKIMVYGNDLLNKTGELQKRELYRITVKLIRSDKLLKYLKRLKPFKGKD